MKRLALILALLSLPAWGAISKISADCTGTNACTTTGNAAGDLELAWACRDGSATAPATPAGWTSVGTKTINGTSSADSACKFLCKVATGADEASGTFTNATSTEIQVYRGQATGATAVCATNIVSAPAANFFATAINTTSTTETFNAATAATPGSWFAGFGYAPAATAGMSTAPTGMTNRNAVGTVMGGHDTNAVAASFASANVTITTASRIITVVAEIKVDTCVNTAYGVFTCIQSAFGDNFGTPATAIFGSNLTAGSEVVCIANASVTTPSFSGCGITWTLPDTAITSGTQRVQHAYGAPAAGACTVTATAASATYAQILCVEIGGTNNTNDGHGLTDIGTITTPNTITATSVNTSVNGDFVLGNFTTRDGTQGLFSALSGTALALDNTSNGIMIEGQVQTSSGAIAPTATNNTTLNFVGGTLAFSPSGGAPAKLCTMTLLGAGPC